MSIHHKKKKKKTFYPLIKGKTTYSIINYVELRLLMEIVLLVRVFFLYKKGISNLNGFACILILEASKRVGPQLKFICYFCLPIFS